MIYELRHYVPHDGKAAALAARFRDHVFPLIEAHNLELLDFWEDCSGNGELWYVMKWEDEAAMNAAWNRFRDDRRWQKARTDSEADGPLTASSESILLRKPDYLPGCMNEGVS